jgi:redox-sensitive bicupin YhaK (pirin superfamily)
MGWGNLRVINEDRVAPGSGFGTHGHRDMEIVSYVLDGELAHKDSMGTGSADGGASGVIRPGDVQRMSAGSGVRHSEFNHAGDRVTHFLQIWIVPDVAGIPAEYEQKHFDDASKRGRLRLIASPDGRDGSLRMHADASISAGLFDAGESAEVALDPKRRAWVQVVRGKVAVNGHALSAGDAVGLEAESALTIADGENAEVLVFDLA